jgi:hypothetical protein
MPGRSDLNEQIATTRPKLRGETCMFFTVSPAVSTLLGSVP